MTPTVSVCIPVYNGETFLAEAIRSVLDQSYRDFELVLLDNASTDCSLEIMQSFDDPRIRIERNPETVGQPENWNRVTDLCRAPLVKLLCADDVLHPRCLDLQVRLIEEDPGLAVVAARRNMIDENSRVVFGRVGLGGLLGRRSASDVVRRVVRSGVNPIGEPGGVLFRRADFVAVGGWRKDYRLVMDIDLWARLLRRGDFLGMPEPLASFRLRRGSVSSENMDAMQGEQRRFTEELGADPLFEVRPVDRTIGRLAAPAGRARSRVLFAASRRAHREADRAAEVAAGRPVR